MNKNTVTDKNSVTNYRNAQDLHQQELRKGILDDTSDLLMREGTAALSMRRIAQLVGCSTTVLYTMFGNKQGLVDELYLRGFDMLRQALEAVPRCDYPQDYIHALCDAYRNFALANSTYYAIMFLKIMPEYTPSKANLKLGEKSLQLLADAIRDCAVPLSISEDAVRDCAVPLSISENEAWEIARMIWATVHGHVGLELAGHFDHPGVSSQQMLNRALRAVVEQFLPLIP